MFETNCTEDQNTHFMFDKLFSPKNLAVYKIMWKNTVEPDCPHVTVWRMRIAYWITMSANSHSEDVILIVFHSNDGCRNAPHHYVIRTIPVVF
jgi:hypothetical protein